MCGRFVRTAKVEDLAGLFEVAEAASLPPSYNVAPTQQVAAVRVDPESAKRKMVALRWGLVPHWAANVKIGYKMINARSETAGTKPSFRSAFRKQRCLIATDGFFEWQTRDGTKQPFFIRLKDHRPFGFACLWEHWESPEGELVESCTILTTTANSVVRPIHDRMPVIVDPADYDRWLDPTIQKPELVQPLLCPYQAEKMTAYPVSPWVNSPRNNGPKCVEPLASTG
jgi:putative SOS response-associated peptidase YedK